MFPKGRMHCCQQIHPHPQKMTFYRPRRMIPKKKTSSITMNYQKRTRQNSRNIMRRNISILQLVGRMFGFFLPWQSDAIQETYPAIKILPFSKSKVYHTEIKPDAATLKLEITRRWKAYHFSGRQPRPANWKIQKCNQFLMANPIPSSEEVDLDWLVSELDEWKGIQQMINESQQREDDRVIHRSWSTDVPFSVSIIHWLMIPYELLLVKHMLPRRGRN